MNTTTRFDLLDIIQALQRNRKFIITIALIAGILGGAFYAVRSKKYQAKSEFILSNPMYADRNFIFRKDESRFIGYFDDDNDMDKAISIINSDTVIFAMVKKFNLSTVYNTDTNMVKVKEIYMKKFEIKRTDYGCLEVTYVDKDAALAINIVNESIKLTESIYQGFFNHIRRNIYNSIKVKLNEIDGTIAQLTDSLVKMRNEYGIYDIISPGRHDIISGSMKGNGKGDYAKGVEVIQNLESIKDQDVMDRAHYISLMNEYSTGINDGENSLFQIISSPKVPKPATPGALITILSGMLVGLFFSSIWVLLRDFYKIKASERN